MSCGRPEGTGLVARLHALGQRRASRRAARRPGRGAQADLRRRGAVFFFDAVFFAGVVFLAAVFFAGFGISCRVPGPPLARRVSLALATEASSAAMRSGDRRRRRLLARDRGRRAVLCLGVDDLDQCLGVVVGEHLTEVGQALDAHGVHERERA